MGYTGSTMASTTGVTIEITRSPGVAWRKSASYDDRLTDVDGPSTMSKVRGNIVQGDVQYLQVTMPAGTAQQYRFVPLKAPNGQELAKIMPQAAPPMQQPPMQQPQQTYQQQPMQQPMQTMQQPVQPPVTYVQQPQQTYMQQPPPVTYVQQPQVQQVTYVQPQQQQYQQVMYNDINRVQQGYGQQAGYPPQGGYNQYGGGGMMNGGGKMKKMKKKGCHGGGGYGGGYGGGCHC